MVTDPKLQVEIPEQMREFAETSVEHARKAFEDYMTAAQSAVAKTETQAEVIQSAAKDAGHSALEFAEANVAAAFDFASKLVKASSPMEMMELQRAFMEEQMKKFTEQSKAMTDKVSSAAGEMAKDK
ncbi:MAG: phasin family protein [Hyphomicrobiales bacterium]|nr:phasin family protein [Hyphomicrobiales bacterium]